MTQEQRKALLSLTPKHLPNEEPTRCNHHTALGTEDDDKGDTKIEQQRISESATARSQPPPEEGSHKIHIFQNFNMPFTKALIRSQTRNGPVELT
jgi:hypothetical protein